MATATSVQYSAQLGAVRQASTRYNEACRITNALATELRTASPRKERKALERLNEAKAQEAIMYTRLVEANLALLNMEPDITTL